MKKKYWFHLLLLFVLVLPYQNCSDGFVAKNANNSINSSAGTTEAFKSYAEVSAVLFQPYCLSCHSSSARLGNLDLSSYSSLVAAGVMTAGLPEQSLLYTQVRNGVMPPTGGVSPSMAERLRGWIANGAPENEVVPPPDDQDDDPIVTPPANALPIVNAGADLTITGPQETVTLAGFANDQDGTIANVAWIQLRGGSSTTLSLGNPNASQMDQLSPVVSGLLLPGTYTFQLTATDDDGDMASDTVDVLVNPDPAVRFSNAVQRLVLNQRCIQCHGSTDQRGGVRFDSYDAVLTQVTPGDSANSNLYQQVLSDNMPRSGNPLTDQQKNYIRDWIDQGALDN